MREHGTASSYCGGCRCDDCRKAWADYHRDYTHRVGLHKPLAEHLAEVVRHGPTRYRKGCRCVVCRGAMATAKRRYRAARQEAERARWREQKRRQRAREVA